MERYCRRNPASTVLASVLFLFSTGMVAQPCLAQYTAGHAVQEYRSGQCGDLSSGRPRGATMGTICRQQEMEAPMLQGATMGTIGPQGSDATYVVGVNTEGTVRVNMLANLEALVNLLANGVEIITVLWGSLLMLGVMHGMLTGRNGLKRCLVSLGVSVSFLYTGLGIVTSLLNSAAFALDPPWKRKDKVHLKFWFALFTIKAGILIPTIVNWLVATARDANLFS